MLDYVEALVRTTSLDKLWKMHCARMAGFGFDRLIYGYTRFSSRDSLGPFEDALFLTNHDQRYIEGFLNGLLFLDAPMLRWARANDGACSWGALWRDPEKLSARERRVISYNASMGVTAGYSIRFPDRDPRAFGMIALTGRPGLSQDDVDRIWARDGRTIEAMNQLLHLKIQTLPHATARGKLSKRQREVLDWVGQGKSNRDIARILGVSLPTVEKHLRLARERLGVETTAQALIKASFMNQISRL